MTIKIIILTFYFHITLYVSYDVFSLIHPSKRDILPPTLDNTTSIFSPNFEKYDIRFDITISPDHVFYKTFSRFCGVFNIADQWRLVDQIIVPWSITCRLSRDELACSGKSHCGEIQFGEKSKCKHCQRKNRSTQAYFLTSLWFDSLCLVQQKWVRRSVR